MLFFGEEAVEEQIGEDKEQQDQDIGLGVVWKERGEQDKGRVASKQKKRGHRVVPGDMSIDQHMEMIGIRLQGGASRSQLPKDRKDHFPDRVAQNGQDIPGADLGVVACQEDADQRHDKPYKIGTSVPQKDFAAGKVDHKKSRYCTPRHQDHLKHLPGFHKQCRMSQREQDQERSTRCQAVEPVDDIHRIHQPHDTEDTEDDRHKVGQVDPKAEIANHGVHKHDGSTGSDHLQEETDPWRHGAVKVFDYPAEKGKDH